MALSVALRFIWVFLLVSSVTVMGLNSYESKVREAETQVRKMQQLVRELLTKMRRFRIEASNKEEDCMLEYNALEETNKKLQDENEELKKKCEEKEGNGRGFKSLSRSLEADSEINKGLQGENTESKSIEPQPTIVESPGSTEEVSR